MDFQRYTNKNYGTTLIIAIILSGMAVTVASLLGRGLLNLKGALTASDKPNALTVVNVMEQERPSLTVTEVNDLPKRQGDSDYHFYAKASDGNYYSIRIDENGPPWKLKGNIEVLHAGE